MLRNHKSNCPCGVCKVIRNEPREPHSEERKRNIARALKGNTNALGYRHTEEAKKRMSEAFRGRPKSEKHKRKLALINIGRRNEKTSRIISRLWKDPEYIAKQIKARNTSPNTSEIVLDRILEELFPGEYKYVGCGDLIIGGKCPDFVNVNSQKKLIELFGNYWHSEKITGVPEEVHAAQRVAGFK